MSFLQQKVYKTRHTIPGYHITWGFVMKKTRCIKYTGIILSFFVVLALVSSATAVPVTNSQPIQESLEKRNKLNDLLNRFDLEDIEQKIDVNRLQRFQRFARTSPDLDIDDYDAEPTPWFPGIIPIGFILGIITWIPAIIISILYAPVFWLNLCLELMDIFEHDFGWFFPLASITIGTLFFTLFAIIWIIVLAVWPLSVIGFFMAMPQQGNPFPDF
jgi:hypothetical protein